MIFKEYPFKPQQIPRTAEVLQSLIRVDYFVHVVLTHHAIFQFIVCYILLSIKNEWWMMNHESYQNVQNVQNMVNIKRA